eukprot:gnl/Chilomastix_caulleri/442.p1 GENE.gnl/Chilomastix_caulleri/442~~gnl/Chilomastix_caulleri/442.p1  ORF type:complete len:109 (+),score=3.73 gnl/Chilomastix_caulleri/442:97-423(+)
MAVILEDLTGALVSTAMDHMKKSSDHLYRDEFETCALFTIIIFYLCIFLGTQRRCRCFITPAPAATSIIEITLILNAFYCLRTIDVKNMVLDLPRIKPQMNLSAEFEL